MSRTMNIGKKRILASVLAVTMAASVVGTVIYVDSTKAHAARATLRGIQELSNQHSEKSEDGLKPFIIYEVVDNYGDAKLGYTIGGEEPISRTSTEAKAIKDMPSKAEREEKMGVFATEDPKYLEGENGAYTWIADYSETIGDDESSTSMDIRGSFIEQTNGNYRYTDVGEGFSRYDGSLQDAIENNKSLYRRMYTYSVSEIKKLTGFDGDNVDIPMVDPYSDHNADPNGKAYNAQFFVGNPIDSYDNLVGNNIFQGSSHELVYIGKIASNEYDEGESKRSIEDGNGNTLVITYDADNNITDVTVTGNFLGMTDAADKFKTDTDWDDVGLYTVESTNSNEGYVYVISEAEDRDGDGNVGTKMFDPLPNLRNYDEDTYNAKGPYWEDNGNSTDYEYRSGNDGDYVFKADYTQGVYHSFEYKNGISNKEWFKQYVFDRTTEDEYKALSIDVRTVKASELTADMVSGAGLIYFNYNSGTPAGNDMDADVAKSIVSKAAAQELSVMLEYATYMDASDGGLANLKGMCLALMKDTVKAVDDLSFVDESGLFFGTKEDGTDISFAKNTVFVNDTAESGLIIGADFNGRYSDSKIEKGFKLVKQENEAELKVIELQGDSQATSFNKDISKATSIRYILNKNTSRVAVKDALRILDIEPYDTSQYDYVPADTHGSYGTSTNLTGNNIPSTFGAGNHNDDDKKNKSALLNLINNSGGQDTRVAFYEYRDVMTADWVVDNLGFTGDKEDIDIKEIGTKEFVGVNEDLNSNYDMIFIGMDTALISTTATDGYAKVNGTNYKIKNFADTRYNNSDMNGLIYTHVGDTYKNYTDSYKTLENASVVASGNDITPDKVRELKDYISAGYAVILSDYFFDSDRRLNTRTVDSSSRMYELMNWLFNGDGKKYLGKNVWKKGDLEATNGGHDSNLSIFSTYLNIRKLEIEVISLPPEYNNAATAGSRSNGHNTGGTAEGNFIPMDGNGNYVLEYKIKLSNHSAVDTSERTSYDCRLYLDTDADGKYEDGESVGGLIINGGEEVEEDGKFHLYTGKEYSISRIVPEGFVGFLSWKLEFVQNGREDSSFDSDAVRNAVIGYSAVPFVGEKPVINVLQITPGNQKNLSDHNYTLDLASADMQNLIGAVKDFDVNIYKVTAENYVKKNNLKNLDGSTYTGTYYGYLKQYDMVVMGFADINGYAISGATEDQLKDSALGIREYALSGRSMLFTHDLTHYGQKYVNSNSYLSMYLRDIMGMDRYHATASTVFKYSSAANGTADFTDEEHTYLSDWDTVTTKGSDRGDKVGLLDAAILRFSSGNNYGLTAKNITKSNALYNRKQGSAITAINEGQITRYPYEITIGTGGRGTSADDDRSVTWVTVTHPQYYQLNLDTDSSPSGYDNDDVVVWYVLSDYPYDENEDLINVKTFYRAMRNDVRNNYYIYTKGNITYSGAGDTRISEEIEKKLFVNTLVAAYNAGVHAPRVIYKETASEASTTITGMHVPYDPELVNNVLDDTEESEGGFLDKELVVNFKTLNNNFRSTTNNLYAKYYVEVDSGGDLVLEGKHYKELEPDRISIINADGQPSNTDAHNLLNYRIYQAVFDLSKINLVSGDNKLNRDNAKIYVRLGLKELPNGEMDSEPGEESMSVLNIYATRLFDLE